MIDLFVPGPPVGKGRHRTKKNGQTYTPKETRLAENNVRRAWQDAGSVSLGRASVRLEITMLMRRPKAHYCADGITLTALGRRTPLPTRKPDWDNVGKLIADSLNGRAWHDDAQVSTGVVHKAWALPGEQEGVIVQAWDACADPLTWTEEAA